MTPSVFFHLWTLWTLWTFQFTHISKFLKKRRNDAKCFFSRSGLCGLSNLRTFQKNTAGRQNTTAVFNSRIYFFVFKCLVVYRRVRAVRRQNRGRCRSKTECL